METDSPLPSPRYSYGAFGVSQKRGDQEEEEDKANALPSLPQVSPPPLVESEALSSSLNAPPPLPAQCFGFSNCNFQQQQQQQQQPHAGQKLSILYKVFLLQERLEQLKDSFSSFYDKTYIPAVIILYNALGFLYSQSSGSVTSEYFKLWCKTLQLLVDEFPKRHDPRLRDALADFLVFANELLSEDPECVTTVFEVVESCQDPGFQRMMADLLSTQKCLSKMEYTGRVFQGGFCGNPVLMYSENVIVVSETGSFTLDSSKNGVVTITQTGKDGKIRQRQLYSMSEFNTTKIPTFLVHLLPDCVLVNFQPKAFDSVFVSSSGSSNTNPFRAKSPPRKFGSGAGGFGSGILKDRDGAPGSAFVSSTENFGHPNTKNRGGGAFGTG